MEIKWIGSPNFDKNRVKIDRVVIHWFGAGNQAGADAQFQKATPGTSAHYSVENDSVHQYVKEENVAYHAGNYAMNQRSIGIEHSAEPNRPASDKTYEIAGRLLGEICKRHDIPLDRTHIIKHAEVKATQCPGTMDLERLISIAKQGGSMGANMYGNPALDLNNAESMKICVDMYNSVLRGDYIKKADADKKAAAEFDRGYDLGKSEAPPAPAPVDQEVDETKWKENGMVVTRDPQGLIIEKTINYERIQLALSSEGLLLAQNY